MRKLSIKLISAVLVCLTLLFAVSVCAMAEEKIPEMPVFDLPCELKTVKVGLCFGSSAVSTAGFQSSSGGFDVGFFDFSRNFHKLGNIADGGISACSGSNAWYILLNNSYGSFSEAASAATSVGGFPAYIDYQYRALIGPFGSSEDAKEAIGKKGCGGSPYIGSDNAILVASSDYGKSIFMYDCAGRYLAVYPNEGSASLDGNSYSGAFELSRKSNCVCVTNYVGLEDYVKGVLPYEVSADWPAEALKSQAVCARTYAYNSINTYVDRGFDVRNDTYSQVYKGNSYSGGVIGDAVDATAHKFVRYGGAVCRVYYMSSDGGGTEDGINVFGERRAYLKAVADTFEVASDFYGKSWHEEFTPLELTYLLNDAGFTIGEVTDVKATYSDMGNVIRLDFADADGNTAFFERLECYSLMGLNSIRYDVSTEVNDDGDTTYVFDGCGWGHNCGMSQWGACSMANNGKISCGDIIKFYFSGAYIA